jgi:hypothetical protein
VKHRPPPATGKPCKISIADPAPLVYTERVGGSNPSPPTNPFKQLANCRALTANVSTNDCPPFPALAPLGPPPEHARPILIPPLEFETAALEKSLHLYQEVERHCVRHTERRFDASD